MEKKVFISYSRKDTEWADKIKEVLEENQIPCWMDRAGIYAGGKYTREIIDAIKSCDIFLLVLSENAEQSQWVPKELGKAIQYHKYIIPVKISSFEIVEFELHLENIQILEVFDLSHEQFRTQLSGIVKSMLKPPAKSLRLVFSLNGGEAEEMEQTLEGTFTVGRSKACSLHFKDYHMSRQHFALEWDGKDLYIFDLGSTNGTYVNRVRLTGRQKLQPDDKIAAGAVKMTVRW